MIKLTKYNKWRFDCLKFGKKSHSEPLIQHWKDLFVHLLRNGIILPNWVTLMLVKIFIKDRKLLLSGMKCSKLRQQLLLNVLSILSLIWICRNSFHAIKTIMKTDGILAIQSGLVPALWYQLVMNGIRLGSYQTMLNVGLTKDKHGNFSFPKSIIAGACAGCMGASIGSPFYMVTI